MATRMAAAPARVPASPIDTENLPQLMSRLGDDVMALVDTKISLLKVEVKEEANTFIRGGVLIAMGGVIATIGFALANVAVALGVATLFATTNLSPAAQYALGFAITGAIYLVLGGIIVLAMKARLARQSVVPPRTVEELRKDTQWLKKEL
ncbi:MAG: hypothetical protein JWM21_4992 [Acidobacteria bacterium]|nr:hypothetical protein [Acidobacteriota bacterium]